MEFHGVKFGFVASVNGLELATFVGDEPEAKLLTITHGGKIVLAENIHPDMVPFLCLDSLGRIKLTTSVNHSHEASDKLSHNLTAVYSEALNAVRPGNEDSHYARYDKPQDTCPNCGSEDLANEDNLVTGELPVQCFDCGHQWLEP